MYQFYLSHTCNAYNPFDKACFYDTGLYQILLLGTTLDTVPRLNTFFYPNVSIELCLKIISTFQESIMSCVERSGDI